MVQVNETIERVTERVIARSQETRRAYLALMAAQKPQGPARRHLSCGNLAHAAAASTPADKEQLARGEGANIGIISAYNDMLSAHQPLGAYPDAIKAVANEHGATAQIAGCVPAMCDGVTQGLPGMDLSLFSRDVIAMATAVSLSHNVFDSTIMLGVCDKIVPGLFMGAARFGHLPCIFLPAGPMASGLPNDEKAKVRQLYAEGRVDRDALLEAESASYHGAGTCTFYGTANSNQMMMEIMGLHIPGSAFVNPGTPLRDAYVKRTASRVLEISALSDEYIPFSQVIDERSIVNAIIGLHATGGSTNHTLHIVAMARAAGIVVNWDDFSDLSAVIPLLCRIYPNGVADVNHFHAAGGIGFVISQLLQAGLLHGDVMTVMGEGLEHYACEPRLAGHVLEFLPAPSHSGDQKVLRSVKDPISKTGGLVVLDGEIGRAVLKISAVAPGHHRVEAEAIVFHSQQELLDQFKAGKLDRDFIAVLPYQGPKANGMPELHKLTPSLSALQARGFKVALVTDGRMSGASGKVPAAIHVSPEALCGGAIARIRTGDAMVIDAKEGVLSWHPKDASATPYEPDLSAERFGLGRELFASMRANVSTAEEGAVSLMLEERF